MTIATAMAWVAAAAVAAFLLRGLFPGTRPGPPKGDSLLYEGAQPSDDLAVRVGPNTFTVGAVVRNDRDGSFDVEDGRGRSLGGPGPAADASLTAPAAWLDVAEVRIGPDPSRLEAIEVRVFDHKTRTLLTNIGGFRRLGSALAAPGVVRLFGLGEPLPDSVDVWLRASSHAPGDPVVRLEARAGASARFSKGSLSVREVHRGARSFTRISPPGVKRPELRWHQSATEQEGSCTAVFDWDGDWAEGRYQICAVATDGRKSFPDVPHFVDFRKGDSTEVIPFDIGPADLSHFELRPFGGRHTFYFADVKLPAPSNLAFAGSPAARIAVDGRPVERPLAEFRPLRAAFHLRRGEWLGGASPRGPVTPAGPIGRQDSAFTAFLEVEGIAGPAWKLAYFDRDGKPLDVTSGGRQTSSFASGTSGFYASWTFEVPLERIGKVEVSPKP